MKALLDANRKILFTAFGGGLYWAASVLLLSSWKPHSLLDDPSSFSTGFIIIATVVLICLLLGLSRFFFKPRFQKSLAIAGILATLAYTILASLQGISTIPLVFLIAGNACHHVFLILFWGLNYASLSKHDAEKTVFISLLFAFALYLCLSPIPAGEYGVYFVGALKTIGVIPFLAGCYAVSVTKRALVYENVRLLFPFYGSRLFLGFFLGPLFFLAGTLRPLLPEPSLGLCVFGLSVLVIAAICAAKSLTPMNSLLRVAPFLIVGFLTLPYFFGIGQLDSLTQAFVAVAWLSWIALSSTQLSDIKECIGLDEAFLSFSEKAVVYFGLLLGYVFTFLAYNSFGDSVRNAVVEYAPLISVYLIILVTCYLFSNLIEKKERQRIVDKAFQLSAIHMKLAFERIALKYSLTERELEVLPLIAKGYTRPYVSKELTISDGTAKTHIAHIYEKLSIHSREELFRLVEEQKQCIKNEQEHTL